MTDFNAKLDFGWGSTPDPAERLTALPSPQTFYLDLGWRSRQGQELCWGTGGEGGMGGPPKLLLNQGPSEPCYATVMSRWRLSEWTAFKA